MRGVLAQVVAHGGQGERHKSVPGRLDHPSLDEAVAVHGDVVRVPAQAFAHVADTGGAVVSGHGYQERAVDVGQVRQGGVVDGRARACERGGDARARCVGVDVLVARAPPDLVAHELDQVGVAAGGFDGEFEGVGVDRAPGGFDGVGQGCAYVVRRDRAEGDGLGSAQEGQHGVVEHVGDCGGQPGQDQCVVATLAGQVLERGRDLA
ncbi:hypothetical protein [Paraoerskovia marina]|uniref:hypothetical protein n=1 Tax=Paraoerskovia marina TaxID=545619 RepID=UPI0012DBD1E0|nr:hypothetical protein [Paraoerskovia marina]